jgi:hypothetical protein
MKAYWLAAALMLAPFVVRADESPKGEPTNAAEATAQKAKTEAEIDAKYQGLVAKLPPDEQTWERVLQNQLGGFYLATPLHADRDTLPGQIMKLARVMTVYPT